MKHFIILSVFILLCCFANAQINYAIVPNLSITKLNDVNALSVGLAGRIEAKNGDGILRFQSGYQAWYTESDVLKNQRIYLNAQAGVVAFPWLRFMGGFTILQEKTDDDGPEQVISRRKWISEFEYTGRIEAQYKRIEFALYLAVGVDSNYHGGLQLQLPIAL